MLVLGIDPGSINTGWALIESSGKKVKYIDSGVLSFDSKTNFLDRLSEIKSKVDDLEARLAPDEIALESLIFVKSPTSLMKLAQTRGIILSAFVEKYASKIFEYSPNEIKSASTGYGHADKRGVEKFLDLMLGKQDYKTHDESDAAAIAICHILKGGNKKITMPSRKSSSGGLAKALAHKI